MTSSALFRGVIAVAALTVVAGSLALLRAEDPTSADNGADSDTATGAVPPRPLGDCVRRGLAYLVAEQHQGGGWGQGGGWRQNRQAGGRVDGDKVDDPTDLGNTCIATLALVRAGNTPQHGPYAANVASAVALICDYVERSDGDSLYATDVRDTQLQSKIGRYVDTFLAGLVLSELKDKMPADGSDKRLLAALEKTVSKIEKNQQTDGNFAGNTGWASVLSQALCSKFINRAAQAEVTVKAEVLDRDFDNSVATLDLKTGQFATSGPGGAVAGARTAGRKAGAIGAGARGSGPEVVRSEIAAGSDAGVHLYAAASNASRISDLGNTVPMLAERARTVLASDTATPEEKENARSQLERIDEVRKAQQAAVGGLVRKLDDKDFIAGFGNNGGEEFLSYMNIAEMLAVKGGAEWESWSKGMAQNLERIQNGDGSWSGHHCITGRTFCSAAALLTLMADRAPVPLAAKIQNSRNQ